MNIPSALGGAPSEFRLILGPFNNLCLARDAYRPDAPTDHERTCIAANDQFFEGDQVSRPLGSLQHSIDNCDNFSE